MIVLIGHGYIASAFADKMRKENKEFVQLSHSSCYTFQKAQESFLSVPDRANATVINCCAFIKNGRADDCEDDKANTWLGNFAFPLTISHACEVLGMPFLHVSTACLYHTTKCGDGWTEEDPPQLSYRNRQDCGTYVASKALAEEAIAGNQKLWIARVRLPFDNIDHPRNYLSKLRNYDKVFDNCNTLAHRYEFVSACLQMIEQRIPYGTYNVMNRGAIWAHDIIAMMNKIPSLAREFVYWDHQEFMSTMARTPKSNCCISSQKLASAGIVMREVSDAVESSLRNWKTNV